MPTGFQARTVAHGFGVDGSGVDLAVDTLLADSPRNQLTVLRAKIEHDNSIGHEIALHGDRGHSPLFRSNTTSAGGATEVGRV